VPELLGSDILYRRWEAAASRRVGSIFLLVHGLGAHGARWGFLAEFLARHGHGSYAIELRGFGRTPERPRGHVRSLGVWEKDILSLREIAVRENPGRKLFLVGESLGGLVAFNLACRHPEAFSGQILVSPAFRSALKFPLKSYLRMALLIAVKPETTMPVPFTSVMCTRDTAYQAVMDGNPDELRVASLKCLMSTLVNQGRSRRLAKTLRVPSLFLLSGNDLLVDESAGRTVFEKLGFPDKTLVEYPEMRHALSIDLDRERVFRDILDWVGKRG
jgi:alpha-beta hydrolase superfamily lysophospholipase